MNSMHEPIMNVRLINVLVNLVLQSKGVELTKLVDEPTNISFTIKLIWMQLSPVELVNLEKKFI